MAFAHTIALGIISFDLFVLSCAVYGIFAVAALRGIARANLFALALSGFVFLMLLSNDWVISRLNADMMVFVYFASFVIVPFNFIIFSLLNESSLLSIGGLSRVIFVMLETLCVLFLAISGVWQHIPVAEEEAKLAALIVCGFASILLALGSIRKSHNAEGVGALTALIAFLAALYLYGKPFAMLIFFGAGALILTIASFVRSPAIGSHTVKTRRAKTAAEKQDHFSFSKTAANKIVVKKTRKFSWRDLFESFQNLFASSPFETMIVHQDSRYDDVGSKISVILSPAYYWYKHSDVAFKSLYAARKFAQSIFYSWIPEGSYRYFVFREPQGYGFIACDPLFVRNKLIGQGLDIYLIDRVYFAQSTLSEECSPLKISDSHELVSLQSVWVTLPLHSETHNEAQLLARPPYFRPQRARVETEDIGKKSFALAAVLIVLLGAALLTDIVRMRGAIDRFETTRIAALENAKLPTTLMQLESIEKRLSAVAATQYGLRERLSKLLGNAQNAKVESIVFEARSLEIRLTPNEGSNTEAIAKAIVSGVQGATSRTDRNQLIVSVKW
ncbi:hypothetical protein AGMMS49521_2080 [Campylobacterota bacterium]|nr:hypothetical protein AGMMS49521_2080 [Campylobacterota bacterium]